MIWIFTLQRILINSILKKGEFFMKNFKFTIILFGVVVLTFFASSVLGAEKVYKWRMQALLNAGEPGYVSLQTHFSDAAEKLSGGRLKIQLHPVGALYPIKEGLEAIKMGVVEIGHGTGGYYLGKMGPIAAIEGGLPGAERNFIERYNFFYSHGFIDIVREAYGKKGVYYLAPHFAPQWDLMSKKPLRKMDDFKGIKVRSYGIEAAWFEAMGASPVFLSGGEIYTAMATGVVDAARWGSPAVNKAISLHEVSKYYIQPSSIAAPNNHFIIYPKAWKSLPDDLKAILNQCALNASLAYIAEGAEKDANAISFMKDKGIEFITIPQEEYSKMEKIVRSKWGAYAEKDAEFAAPAIKLLNSYLRDLGR
jgi:TRAP-type C4-dicarboxylate transport system substrate-binding protein